MRPLLIFLALFLTQTLAFGAEYCATGVKGTLTAGFTGKLAHSSNSDRTLTLIDANKNVLFASKAENRFTQFSASGYGVCSIGAECSRFFD